MNGGHIAKALKPWTVAAHRFLKEILNLTTEELKNIDRKTHQIMTIKRALHPTANVARLYIPSNTGGKGLRSAEKTIRD